MTVRAVFWDVDGTMVMSEAVHDAKMHHIAQSHGLNLSSEVMAKFYGTGDYTAYEIMRGIGMPGTMEEFLQRCDDYYRDSMHMVEMREGFMDAFSHFEQHNMVQGAVSNGVKPLVEMNIDRTGIGRKLKAVIDLDYITSIGLNPKPAADPYLEALRQVNESEGLDIHPSECLVIEDSPVGVRAGKAAGMKAIFWNLFSEKTSPDADFEAHTGAELMEIVLKLQPVKVAV